VAAGDGPVEDLLAECVVAVKAHCRHPAVRKWFRAAHILEAPMPGLGVGEFPVVEFRDGRLGAQVWSDGPGTWGTGGWHPLPGPAWARPAAHGLPFAEVLDALVALRAAAGPPSRPWWRFW
jgi:hypothetical protein